MKFKPVAGNVVDADNMEVPHATGQVVVEQSVVNQSPQKRSEEHEELILPAGGTSSSSSSSPLAVGRKSPAAESKKIVKATVSGDEHRPLKKRKISAKEWRSRDAEFAECMEENGYKVKPVEGDGACLFRSISVQIYGDQGMHDVIRQHTMDYIQENREYFGQFVAEDIGSYIQRKRAPNAHGNHIEIQAISEIFNRIVEVYCYQATPIKIFSSEQSQVSPPLRLSYQHGCHYNAILDTCNASFGVGVGLGWAGYKPQAQTEEASRLGEQQGIEQTDLEGTNEAIEEQIAREPYLEWCRENMQRTAGGSPGSTRSPSTAASVQRSSKASKSQVRTTLPKKRRRESPEGSSMKAIEAPITPGADQQQCTSKQSSPGDAPSSSSSNTYMETLKRKYLCGRTRSSRHASIP